MKKWIETEWIKTVGTKEMVMIACPHCDELLNLPEDETKVKVKVQVRGEEGTLVLSAIWGDYESEAQGVEIGYGDVVTMLCPHCGNSFQGEEPCDACGATVTIFRFSNGAIGICNRKGCRMHLRSKDAKISISGRLILSVSAWGGPYERL